MFETLSERKKSTSAFKPTARSIMRILTESFVAGFFLLMMNANLHAQGTAFSYQGQLNDTGTPANGTYDFTFRLASDPLGNNYVGQPYRTNAMLVINGQFSTTIDFGGMFSGGSYWLEVDVRTNGANYYSTLQPLQPITPEPYAMFATTAQNVSGVVPLANLPPSVVLNDQSGVSFGNVTLSGYLNLGTTTLTSGGNTLLTELSIDSGGGNIGKVTANALVFGDTTGNTGEGIASKRIGTNPYDLEFFTDFNNRMTINHSGNVGIGTPYPTETLEINGNSRLDDFDMYLRAGSDHNHALGYRSSVGGIATDGPFLYGWGGGALGTTGPESIALKWDASGTVSVRDNVLVNGGLSIDQTGQNSGSVGSDALVFGGVLGSSGEGISSKRSGSNPFDLEFFTGWGTRMTILNNGNVGIGTSTPVAQLDVKAASSSAPALNIAQGAFKVAGAGVGTHTTAFIQLTTQANLSTAGAVGQSMIDNPICNGNPKAILIAVYNISASTNTGTAALYQAPIAVEYFQGHWYLYDATYSPLAVGLAFNVLVIVP